MGQRRSPDRKNGRLSRQTFATLSTCFIPRRHQHHSRNEEKEQSAEATQTKEKTDSIEATKADDPEVMEVDRKVNPSEKSTPNDDDVFVKPPAMDEKQKVALTAAYKLPGKGL